MKGNWVWRPFKLSGMIPALVDAVNTEDCLTPEHGVSKELGASAQQQERGSRCFLKELGDIQPRADFLLAAGYVLVTCFVFYEPSAGPTVLCSVCSESSPGPQTGTVLCCESLGDRVGCT